MSPGRRRAPEVETPGASVRPLARELVGASVRPLALLLGAAGFLLLVGCANVASALLARGTGRRVELAVRRSLGAGRGHTSARRSRQGARGLEGLRVGGHDLEVVGVRGNIVRA